jgi:hypothetical protein
MTLYKDEPLHNLKCNKKYFVAGDEGACNERKNNKKGL